MRQSQIMGFQIVLFLLKWNQNVVWIFKKCFCIPEGCSVCYSLLLRKKKSKPMLKRESQLVHPGGSGKSHLRVCVLRAHLALWGEGCVCF